MITRARSGRKLLLALCALCWLAFPAYASDESRANRLFVEAVKLIQTAEEEDGAERKLDLLKRARHKLETIVDRHPSSGLAVKLISGQKIGTISLAGLADEIEAAVVHACPHAPTLDCVLSMAVATAKTIEEASGRAWAFSGIAGAQAKAGYISEAFATAETIEEAGPRAWAFAGIAEAQAKAGYISEAFATVKVIEAPYPRAEAFAEIAVAQARKGDAKQAGETFAIALETAKVIEYPHSRAEVFIEIAGALAESD